MALSPPPPSLRALFALGLLLALINAATLAAPADKAQPSSGDKGAKQKADCSMTSTRAAQLLKLWDGHIATEFSEKSADAAVATMVPDASVNHVPVITGGSGTEGLRKFYGEHFIPRMPADVKIVPLERTVGKDAKGGETVVDELLFEFSHTTAMDWMLPGVAPTGKKVSVPLVVVVKFKGDKLLAERIYWDQATVLRQIGVLPDSVPAVTSAEQARKAQDPASVQSNQLIERAAASKAARP